MLSVELCVLCASVVDSQYLFTTEAQRAQRLHREAPMNS